MLDDYLRERAESGLPPAQRRAAMTDYRDLLAAYLRGEDVTTRKGRPWPRDERTRTAARMLLKRIAECEPPLPVVHEQPPREDAI